MEQSSKRNAIPLTLYIIAIVLANWLVTCFGQAALPFTAFFLIPFDLIVRDLMQDRWQGRTTLWWRMGLLILGGGLISVATATGSVRVNVASLTAFVVAGACDALTYQWMIRYGRVFRINGATVLAAVTDSIVFGLIAFDHASWRLILAQIGMKAAGGLVWSLVMFRFFKKRPAEDPHAPYLVSTWRRRDGVEVRYYNFSHRPLETVPVQVMELDPDV